MASPIQAVSQLASSTTQLGAPAAASAHPSSAPFSDLITDAVNQVDALQARAQSAVTDLMTGKGVDVHTAMIATEKAGMAFELSLAVRNNAVQAYQQVMNMQF